MRRAEVVEDINHPNRYHILVHDVDNNGRDRWDGGKWVGLYMDIEKAEKLAEAFEEGDISTFVDRL